MSIATAINDLSGRIQDAYTALEAKGATMPVEKDTWHLSTTIDTIPAGGGDITFALGMPNNQDYNHGITFTIDGITYPSGTYSLFITNPQSIQLQSKYWGTNIGESSATVNYADGTSQTILANTTLTPTQSLAILNWHDQSCLDGTTLILMADGSERRIDQIHVGDRVTCVLPDGSHGEDVVTYSDSDTEKYGEEKDVWTFDDGTEIITIHPHEFYNVERGHMTYIADFNIGEHVLKIDGRKIALVGHKTICERTQHYTIFTSNYNTYFANGILTGNRYSAFKETK